MTVPDLSVSSLSTSNSHSYQPVHKSSSWAGVVRSKTVPHEASLGDLDKHYAHLGKGDSVLASLKKCGLRGRTLGYGPVGKFASPLSKKASYKARQIWQKITISVPQKSNKGRWQSEKCLCLKSHWSLGKQHLQFLSFFPGAASSLSLAPTL